MRVRISPDVPNEMRKWRNLQTRRGWVRSCRLGNSEETSLEVAVDNLHITGSNPVLCTNLCSNSPMAEAIRLSRIKFRFESELEYQQQNGMSGGSGRHAGRDPKKRIHMMDQI